MPEIPFNLLSRDDRRDVLDLAAGLSGRRAHLLEKDIWVVDVLRALFEAPFHEDLVFKGGTSLSKAHHVIRRFSEDVDITYSIRAIVPELVGHGDGDPIPPTRSQEKRWTRRIRSQLAEWVREQALPVIATRLGRADPPPRCHADENRIHVVYAPLFPDDYGFVTSAVAVEFGARSTGEPCAVLPVRCDAATHLPDVEFPSACPSVMLAERTFWEKATAVHAFCRRERFRGDRLGRHWHDLVRLDEAGIASNALADRSLALSVACHKAVFFREKDIEGHWIDYEAAVSGGLQLVPTGPAFEALARDYADMVRGGMLFDDEISFEVLIERCADLEARANACRN